jgi:hypothetical protein
MHPSSRALPTHQFYVLLALARGEVNGYAISAIAVNYALGSRLHYRLTSEGRLRLIEEVKRLQHAVKIAESAGLLNDDIPPEIRRLLGQLR